MAMADWVAGRAAARHQQRPSPPLLPPAASRARPLRQARDWGYQRITAARALLQVDAAPPPIARVTDAGCASTLAFEFSDGPHRIIVNCGGASLAGAIIPADLAFGLRTTAAHSTLTLADQNSTAILPDGTLGKGVTQVEIDRREVTNDKGGASRLELSHDGYVKRHGFAHRRLLILANSGWELRGEDMLVPQGRKRRHDGLAFAIRFHLGPDVEPSLTADGQGALLRLAGGCAMAIALRRRFDAHRRQFMGGQQWPPQPHFSAGAQRHPARGRVPASAGCSNISAERKQPNTIIVLGDFRD